MMHSQIPVDWKQVILRDICKEYRYGFTASAQQKPIGPKFLRITDIVPDLIDWDSVPYCEIDKNDVEKYTLQEGDIVIARTGATTGYAKRIKKNHPPSIFASYLVRLRLKDEVCEQFIGQVVESNIYKEFIKTNIGGAAQPNANAQILTSYRFLLPPLATQRKIADILFAYDDLIENNTRRIKILEEMAQAIYREWFVHYRFPGYEDIRMVNSGTEIGEIPEGWEIIKLSKLVETQYGYTESTRDEAVGPKYLRGMDINKTPYIDWSEVPYCPINEEDYEKYRLNRGDVVIIRMADPGKIGIVEKAVNAVFASYLIRLIITSNRLLSSYYLFYSLLSDRYQGYITGASTGTTRKSASAPVIVDYNMLIPRKEIIDEFDHIVSPIRQLLNSLLDKNAILRKIRDLFLPKLISGEIDVSKLEII